MHRVPWKEKMHKRKFWNLLGYLSIWCQDHLCPNYSQQMFVKLFFNVGFLAPLKTHLSAPSLSVPAELTPFGSGVLQEGFPASAQTSLSPRQSQFFPPGARFCSAPRCGWTASPSRSWSSAAGLSRTGGRFCPSQRWRLWFVPTSDRFVFLTTACNVVGSCSLCDSPQFPNRFLCLCSSSLSRVWTRYSHLREYIPWMNRASFFQVTSPMCHEFSDSSAILPGVYRLLSWAWFYLRMPTNTLLSLLPHHSRKYRALPDLEQTSLIPTRYNPTILTPNRW